MNLQLEEIQPGWIVIGADGEELGNVIAVALDAIRIQKPGLLGGELRAPRRSADFDSAGPARGVAKRSANT